MQHGNGTTDVLIAWCRNAGVTTNVRFDMGLGFTQDFHTYEFKVHMEDDFSDVALVRNRQRIIHIYIELLTCIHDWYYYLIYI